jgi:D-alanyl-D-alanine carboxypeptidase
MFRRLAVATSAGIVAAGLTITLAPPGAQAAPSAAPVTTPKPTTSYAGKLEKRLDRRLAKVVRAGAVGVTAEVGVRGTTAGAAAGKAQTRPRLWATRDDRFRAGSVSKQLVSVLALQLVEKGTWTLDTTLGDVVPDVWPEHAGVTLRQLLSHTSGAPDFLVPLISGAATNDDFVEIAGRHYSDAKLVAAARTQPWLFEPGTSMTYSNTNYVLVGMMLKRETDRSLARLVDRRVFRPVGMSDSRWPRQPGLQKPALHEYGVSLGERIDLADFDPSMFSGAGALVTTPHDLNLFQRALSDGSLISADSLAQMRSVIGQEMAYGLGSYRLPDPCGNGFVHGHDGGTWGTVTLSFSNPNGNRRVSLGFTGRNLDGDPAATIAAVKVVTKSLSESCPGGNASRVSSDAFERGLVARLESRI